MHKQYFPICPVDGPIDPPIAYANMLSTGAVPNKCGNCEHLFEGECTRYIDDVGGYLHLDHGPCGIDGPTDPVVYEDYFITSKVEVPRKCATCRFLSNDSIHGFHCRKDADKWGDLPRGLDWGNWEPDFVYVQLPPPKVTTKAMAKNAQHNNLLEFIKEHRRVNPQLSIKEAQNDYDYFRSIYKKHKP